MDTLKTALTTAFTGVKTDTLDIMGVALPAALGICLLYTSRCV